MISQRYNNDFDICKGLGKYFVAEVVGSWQWQLAVGSGSRQWQLADFQPRT